MPYTNLPSGGSGASAFSAIIGSDIASASTIVLPDDAFLNRVTGTTRVNLMTPTAAMLSAGKGFKVLQFDSSCEVRDNFTPSGDAKAIRLRTESGIYAIKNATGFYFNGTDWRHWESTLITSSITQNYGFAGAAFLIADGSGMGINDGQASYRLLNGIYRKQTGGHTQPSKVTGTDASIALTSIQSGVEWPGGVLSDDTKTVTMPLIATVVGEQEWTVDVGPDASARFVTVQANATDTTATFDGATTITVGLAGDYARRVRIVYSSKTANLFKVYAL